MVLTRNDFKQSYQVVAFFRNWFESQIFTD